MKHMNHSDHTQSNSDDRQARVTHTKVAKVCKSAKAVHAKSGYIICLYSPRSKLQLILDFTCMFSSDSNLILWLKWSGVTMMIISLIECRLCSELNAVILPWFSSFFFKTPPWFADFFPWF